MYLNFMIWYMWSVCGVFSNRTNKMSMHQPLTTCLLTDFQTYQNKKHLKPYREFKSPLSSKDHIWEKSDHIARCCIQNLGHYIVVSMLSWHLSRTLTSHGDVKIFFVMRVRTLERTSIVYSVLKCNAQYFTHCFHSEKWKAI